MFLSLDEALEIANNSFFDKYGRVVRPICIDGGFTLKKNSFVFFPEKAVYFNHPEFDNSSHIVVPLVLCDSLKRYELILHKDCFLLKDVSHYFELIV